jgi:DNA-directed RNA polymerase specialized sigma24 family protein
MVNRNVDPYLSNDDGTDFTERVRLNEQKLIFDARFRRCYRVLHFIACHVLGSSERAEEAIGSCWRVASRRPRQCEREGEFHSWLLRVLIDEALVLLRESMPTPAPKVLCEPVPAHAFRPNDRSDSKSDICNDDQKQFPRDLFMAFE